MPILQNYIGRGLFTLGKSCDFSGASTVTSISTIISSRTSHNVNEGKEQIGAPTTQGDKARPPIILHLQMNAPPYPVDEFLLQLTKMLTDDNKDYIEWHKVSLCVTNPPGLEKFILPRYFRHSNYSSFVSALLHIHISSTLVLHINVISDM